MATLGGRSIEDMGMGECALAWDEDTSRVGAYEVMSLIRHTDSSVLHLIIDGVR